jgi:hypothetical protein
MPREGASVRLNEGFSISGRVLDPDGKEVGFALVERRLATGGWIGVRADAGGAFVIRGLEPGKTALRARIETVAGPTVMVEAGKVEVVLRLPQVRTLTVSVHDWNPEILGPFGYLYRSKPRASLEHVLQAGISPSGVISFRGLDPESEYILWIAPRDSNYCVHEAGIRMEAGSMTVTAKLGYEMRGRLVAPEPILSGQIRARGVGFTVRGEVDESGEYLVRGVPLTECLVMASARTKSGNYHGRERVQAGVGRDLTLSPSR